jgi:release factor glutamine methyltransferase
LDHSIRSLLHEATDRLACVPDGAPRLEAELLLAEASGLARTRLIAWPEEVVNPAVEKAFWKLVNRRRDGEPVAYLLGRQEFWSLELRVTPDALIPRPETELLVEAALDRLPANALLRVLDAGSGSGAVAAALAHERPSWLVVAIEQSGAAAQLARRNLQRLTGGNTCVVRGDWLASVGPRSLDAVISNPPYVPESDPHLTRGDLRFEPRCALVGGQDGLSAIRRLAAQATFCLRPDGFLAFEHGSDQGPAVRRFLAGAGYADIETCRDLAGHERVTLARLPWQQGTRACTLSP